MTTDDPGQLAGRSAGFSLDGELLAVLRNELPLVAAHTVAAVTSEVPGYQDAFAGPLGRNLEDAVRMAIGGFLALAGGARDTDPATPRGPTREGAYALGRGEARSGRSMDSLLAAYRVGARVSWQGLAQTATAAGMTAGPVAEFAELLFAYIDELSATSVAGYHDERTTSGRVRERYRERLGQRLLAGAGIDVLTIAAERADWVPPRTLTAVLLPAAHVHGVLALLGGDPLVVGEDLPGADQWQLDQPRALVLVADVEARDHAHLLRVLTGRQAVVGPARPWTEARTSYDRVVRTATLMPEATSTQREPVDTEAHLAELVVTADAEARGDLRTRVLAPLSALTPATRERLAETLISWLLHQGRRDAVAADLHVHAQTVRYRMQQIRELYGDRLHDPRFVRELVVALPLHP